MRQIIGIIGKNGSGKSDAAKLLLEIYEKRGLKAKVYSFSTVLRLILDYIEVVIDREKLIKLSEVLRSCFGQRLLSKYISEEIEVDDVDVAIVEGVRRHPDLSKLRPVGAFYLINIEVDPKICYQRLIARKQNQGDENKSYEEFLADQESEPERDVEEVAKSADITIENNGSPKELNLQLELIVVKYLLTSGSNDRNETAITENFDYLDHDYL